MVSLQCTRCCHSSFATVQLRPYWHCPSDSCAGSTPGRTDGVRAWHSAQQVTPPCPVPVERRAGRCCTCNAHAHVLPPCCFHITLPLKAPAAHGRHSSRAPHLAPRAVPQEEQPPLLLQNLLLAGVTHGGCVAARHLQRSGGRGHGQCRVQDAAKRQQCSSMARSNKPLAHGTQSQATMPVAAATLPPMTHRPVQVCKCVA